MSRSWKPSTPRSTRDVLAFLARTDAGRHLSELPGTLKVPGVRGVGVRLVTEFVLGGDALRSRNCGKSGDGEGAALIRPLNSPPVWHVRSHLRLKGTSHVPSEYSASTDEYQRLQHQAARSRNPCLWLPQRDVF